MYRLILLPLLHRFLICWACNISSLLAITGYFGVFTLKTITYVHVYIYTNIHTCIQKDKQTGRQTAYQTDISALSDGQTDSLTDRHITITRPTERPSDPAAPSPPSGPAPTAHHPEPMRDKVSPNMTQTIKPERRRVVLLLLLLLSLAANSSASKGVPSLGRRRRNSFGITS